MFGGSRKGRGGITEKHSTGTHKVERERDSEHVTTYFSFTSFYLSPFETNTFNALNLQIQLYYAMLNLKVLILLGQKRYTYCCLYFILRTKGKLCLHEHPLVSLFYAQDVRKMWD